MQLTVETRKDKHLQIPIPPNSLALAVGGNELHLDEIAAGIELLLPWQPLEPRVMQFIGKALEKINRTEEWGECPLAERQATLFISEDGTQVALAAFLPYNPEYASEMEWPSWAPRPIIDRKPIMENS